MEWSPFDPALITVSEASNFGIIGPGSQSIYRLDRKARQLTLVAKVETKDGAYDCCWNEGNQTQVLFGLGDGNVILWDWTNGTKGDRTGSGVGGSSLLSGSSGSGNLEGGKGKGGRGDTNGEKMWGVVQEFKEHKEEVFTVDWNLMSRERVVSGSWDKTLKLWNVEYKNSLRTYNEHKGSVYSAVFHPKYDDMFASASGDKTVKIWYVVLYMVLYYII